MNFTVKLTIGVNVEGKYIQYSVNKVEVKIKIDLKDNASIAL